MVERGESAPAEIEPGLLAATLAAQGKGFEVRDAATQKLPGLVRSLDADDLLIAIAAAAAGGGRGAGDRDCRAGVRGEPDLGQHPTRRLCAVHGRRADDPGVAGGGAAVADVGAADPGGGGGRSGGGGSARRADGGDLRAPGAGDRPQPAGLGRRPRSGGGADPGSGRPGRGAAGRARHRLLPLVLLLGAALEPGETVETLLAMLGAPLLAALTLGLLGGYRALAVASGLTVGAYAVDVIAGSPLTSLSLLGPNPGLGVRFYGIGNELEALLAVLIVAGTGAGLTGFGPRLSPRACATAFLALGLAAALRLRRRALRRRRRRGDRLPGRRRRRRGDDRRTPPPHGAPDRRPAVRGPGPARPGRPRLRRQRAPHPLGPRRRRAGRPRRRRPAPPAALRPQLLPPDRLRLPAADRRSGRARGRAPRAPARLAAGRAGDARRPDRRRVATAVGTLANDSGRPAAGDRRRLPARLRRLRLGGGADKKLQLWQSRVTTDP